MVGTLGFLGKCLPEVWWISVKWEKEMWTVVKNVLNIVNSGEKIYEILWDIVREFIKYI